MKRKWHQHTCLRCRRPAQCYGHCVLNQYCYTCFRIVTGGISKEAAQDRPATRLRALQILATVSPQMSPPGAQQTLKPLRS